MPALEVMSWGITLIPWAIAIWILSLARSNWVSTTLARRIARKM